MLFSQEANSSKSKRQILDMKITKFLPFEINQTKIKGGSQLGIKVVPHDSTSDLPLVFRNYTK